MENSKSEYEFHFDDDDDDDDAQKYQNNLVYVYSHEEEEEEKKESDDDDINVDELVSEWKIRDKEIESTKKARELNTKLVNKAKVKNLLKKLNAQTTSMEESIEAQENLIFQLDAAIGRGKQEVIYRRQRIEELKEQIRLQNQEYNATHRLFQLEMNGLKRLPVWWLLMMLTHLILVYMFIKNARLLTSAVHFIMFLAHYKAVYVKTSGVYTLISLIIFAVEIFFVARTFN